MICSLFIRKLPNVSHNLNPRKKNLLVRYFCRIILPGNTMGAGLGKMYSLLGWGFLSTLLFWWISCRSTVPQEVPKIESSNPLIYCFILCIMWIIGHYSIIVAIHLNVFVGFYHRLVTWAFQLVFFFVPSAASPVDNGSIKSMVEMMALYRILHLSKFCIFKCSGNQCA